VTHPAQLSTSKPLSDNYREAPATKTFEQVERAAVAPDGAATSGKFSGKFTNAAIWLVETFLSSIFGLSSARA